MGDIIKKIVGTILALLMVVCMIPAGLFYLSTPVVAEGQFVKISPSADTFVYSEAKNKNKSKLDNDNDIIGNYWNTYMKYDLSQLSNTSRNDITSAKLRFAVTYSKFSIEEGFDCSFNISYVENNNWNENMTWSNKPRGEEQYICTASGAASGSVLEVDITEFIKQAISLDDTDITLKMGPTLSSNSPIKIASKGHEDPSKRPYLKIVVGNAKDNDPALLNKSYLDTSVYVSKMAPDMNAADLLEKNNNRLAVDNGSITYLRFNIDPRNIKGAVYNAQLFLRPILKSGNTKIDVYYLENNDWNPEALTYNNQPEGKRKLIESFNGIDVGGNINIDVSEIIYSLVDSGIYTATFLFDGTSTDLASTDTIEFYSQYDNLNAPSLAIAATDNKDVVAIREALDNIKGDNTSLDNITEDLPHSYIAQNGERVSIKWLINEEFSIMNALGLTKSAISTSGKINQPTYFEDEKKVRVKVVLTVGNEYIEKFYDLTIRPEFGVQNRLYWLNKGLE